MKRFSFRVVILCVWASVESVNSRPSVSSELYKQEKCALNSSIFLFVYNQKHSVWRIFLNKTRRGNKVWPNTQDNTQSRASKTFFFSFGLLKQVRYPPLIFFPRDKPMKSRWIKSPFVEVTAKTEVLTGVNIIPRGLGVLFIRKLCCKTRWNPAFPPLRRHTGGRREEFPFLYRKTRQETPPPFCTTATRGRHFRALPPPEDAILHFIN